MATPVVVARFGRYAMQHRIGAVGACELWRVEAADPEDAQRCSVLYKLKAEHVRDRQFVEMFVADGRRAMRLRHPNISKTEEVLIDRNDVGVVSEFVDGVTVRSIVEQVRRCKNSVPVWFALHVTRAVCDALGYAHALKDEAGYPDPSHHQAFCSDRVVITGVGSALSRQISSLQVGRALRESGEVVLERSSPRSCAKADITGVARVLYELLTLVTLPKSLPNGQLPFVPPSHHAPWVQRGVGDMIERALASESVNAFTQMSQFAEAIEEHLAERRQSVQSEHIAAFIQVLARSSCPDGPPPICTGSQAELARSALIRVPRRSPASIGVAKEAECSATVEVVDDPTPTKNANLVAKHETSSRSQHDGKATIGSSQCDNAKPAPGTIDCGEPKCCGKSSRKTRPRLPSRSSRRVMNAYA